VTPTHAEVLAAIDKARDIGHSRDCEAARFHPGSCDCEHHERGSHCDDLRATAERHAQQKWATDPDGPGYCDTCVSPISGTVMWPCADAQQVIDRLTSWGVV
jgi:hypothetical protein